MLERAKTTIARTGNLLALLCLGYYLLMSLIAPGFFTAHNSWTLLYNLLPLLILGLGQTYVMLGAGIDLSVTSTVAMCSVCGAYAMSADTAWFADPAPAILAGVMVMLAVGAAIGLVNGLAVSRLRMPAFMVTLTTMIFFSGLAVWLTQSQNIYNLPENLVNLPYTRRLGLPLPAYLGALVLAAAYLILNRTLFGEWLYAIGNNPKASRISGVRVGQTLLLTYLFSGVCAALAALLYTARLETGSPVMGQNLLLDVIGAVVIGGTSLFGGKGKVEWTFFGVLFITLLDNSLNLLGLSYFIIMVVKGAVILGAAGLFVLKRNGKSDVVRVQTHS